MRAAGELHVRAGDKNASRRSFGRVKGAAEALHVRSRRDACEQQARKV
jgi:hypothetical protein